jgi:triosephosphate isomerase
MIIRKKIIAGNWKMNKTQAEARVIVEDILREIGRFDEAEIVLCPPFTALAVVSELLSPVSNIRLGAQNMHEAASGAYTGEISAGMLRELYVRYVIIGHSERRQYFHQGGAGRRVAPDCVRRRDAAGARIGAVEKGPRDPVGRGAGRFW